MQYIIYKPYIVCKTVMKSGLQEALRRINENHKNKTKYLNLFGLGLESIPSEILKLDHLELLDLSYNQIKKIENLYSLNNLLSLNLGENRISKIEGLDDLNELKELFLHSNHITKIEGINNLKKLTILNLRDNRISKIEGDFEQLEKIDIVDLAHNPIEYPPMEIVEKGIEAVMRYANEVERTGKKNVNAAKLLLTGSGEVGKTSLRLKLKNKNAKLPQKDERTKKVDVDSYTFKKTNSDEVFTVYIWDFGGQQIVHHFHRFFMNREALYLLITETSRNDDQIDYWLQTIKLYGKKSPILFVQNQMNGIPKRFDINPYKEDFNLQEDVFKVNLLTSEGLTELEESIKYHMQKLPFIKRAVPKSWFEINEALNDEAKKMKHTIFPLKDLEKYANRKLVLKQKLALKMSGIFCIT